jgi:ferredoxin
MRVRVDARTCQGHARCLTIAPRNFGFLDEDGIAIVTTEQVPQGDIAGVEEAAIECPTGAIKIDTEEQDASSRDRGQR